MLIIMKSQVEHMLTANPVKYEHTHGGSWTEGEVRMCRDPEECLERPGRKSKLNQKPKREGKEGDRTEMKDEETEEKL